VAIHSEAVQNQSGGPLQSDSQAKQQLVFQNITMPIVGMNNTLQ
jgi:hypothetical protein